MENRLREIRESQGLDLFDLAERTGFSEITLRNWEKGKHDPLFKIRVLADALGVKPSDLFEG